MVLSSLLELMVTLRSRIDTHGAALRQSEALTRAVLIDPLLRELGWDTENAALVVPEYRGGRGSADYALVGEGKPVVMVEAKRLGSALEGAAEQGIGYCLSDGVPYFAVTDGARWQVYETHKMAPIDEKLVASFDVSSGKPGVCLMALVLWRPTAERGVVSVGAAPVAGMGSVVAVDSPSVSAPAPRNDAPVEVAADEGEWLAIDALFARVKSMYSPPERMRFPDGSAVRLQGWNKILLETARWLLEKRHLHEGNWRVKRRTLYIVCDSEIQPGGESFRRGVNIGPVWVETKYGKRWQIKSAMELIEHVGLDIAGFGFSVDRVGTPTVP